MADWSQMSRTSVCKFVGLTATGIASLASEYLKFPNARDVTAIIQKFHTIAGMPEVIGCIDGSHFPVRGPGGNEAELYRCRKGYFSINTQGICDADLKFMNTIASWPGTVHNSRIIKNSQVCHILKQGNHPGYLETVGTLVVVTYSYLSKDLQLTRSGATTQPTQRPEM
ncbi:putative nuclease HARBI1 [Penaeus vannamei]|uniref:putative nuclease HARBI1 n=1 Tax=Penaeus vannamei TaxID=6689 RepID=UPI00387F8FE8